MPNLNEPALHPKQWQKIPDRIHNNNHGYYFVLDPFTVQAHLLHVDLATQFNPFVMKIVKDSEESCAKCEQVTTSSAEAPPTSETTAKIMG